MMARHETKIKIGDTVKLPGWGGATGQVIGVHDAWVWLNVPDHSPITYEAGDLKVTQQKVKSPWRPGR